jgi:hypothetical protein
MILSISWTWTSFPSHLWGGTKGEGTASPLLETELAERPPPLPLPTRGRGPQGDESVRHWGVIWKTKFLIKYCT